MICSVSSFGLLLLRFATGFHWGGPVRHWSALCGDGSHNAGRAAATATPPGLLKQAVDANETVLG